MHLTMHLFMYALAYLLSYLSIDLFIDLFVHLFITLHHYNSHISRGCNSVKSSILITFKKNLFRRKVFKGDNNGFCRKKGR